MSIHQTAIIHKDAELDSTVEIGPYVVIDGPVKIGAGTSIGAHAVLTGRTTIGENNQIGPFVIIGAPPQDLHYKGEDTEVVIGDKNVIREYVSVHRGTKDGGGKTIIGSHNMIMAYCHIAHDCMLADHIIMANLATLGGHVQLFSHVGLGGHVAIHQHCRVGEYAFVGGMSGIGQDIPPYVLMEGTRTQARISGLNKIGLTRVGMSRENIAQLEKAFRMLFLRPANQLFKDALEKVRCEMADCPEAQRLVAFIQENIQEKSTRKVFTRTRLKGKHFTDNCN